MSELTGNTSSRLTLLDSSQKPLPLDDYYGENYVIASPEKVKNSFVRNYVLLEKIYLDPDSSFLEFSIVNSGNKIKEGRYVRTTTRKSDTRRESYHWGLIGDTVMFNKKLTWKDNYVIPL